ncbi:tubulin-tyrosine ligase family protein [Penicillium angulare]|uniref:Tubulin-tyrosine ligase family protein n=1 Tax=Penicillium angulare TaxID=116970 RepID=A0A9W9FIA7_9EURO|nr:tubulin-tyrosine ligase family protein [Penicillium angulare]
MHILVANDDGPPDASSSPYVHSLVSALESAGHVVSVIVPSQQRSWVGKAHFIDQVITPTYYTPGPVFQYAGAISDVPPTKNETPNDNHWVLIDSTPASCVQIGLNHYFKDRGPVDLVVSGPNLGQNATVLFSLSSGTIGAAMEGALCGKRAVALSFEDKTNQHEPAAVTEASKHAVKLIEHLHGSWPEDVDLYTVNMPLKTGISQQRILYTSMFKNRWSPGISSFQEIISAESGRPQKQFRWAPKLDDIRASVHSGGPTDDGLVVERGFTSVTPLKANFMHTFGYEGEIKLA